MDELKCRKRVLRRMGYCIVSDVIEFKGRVACEISRLEQIVIIVKVINCNLDQLRMLFVYSEIISIVMLLVQIMY